MDLRLNTLKQYIRENTRADNVSGIKFIDPRGYEDVLNSKQNYVVHGRRGAGKSSLLKTLKDGSNFTVHVNIEDIKDISFPNILLKLLLDFLSQIDSQFRNDVRWWQFSRKSRFKTISNELNQLREEYEEMISSPDSFEEETRTKRKSKDRLKAKGKVPGASVQGRIEDESENETKGTYNYDKLDDLKISINKIKIVIEKLTNFANPKAIFLVLDDLYFAKKEVQPSIVDYFHRLSKGNDFYLKIGTIKHRSRLYSQNQGNYIGMELNADIYEIDLDYTLDKWNELKLFMQQLLEEAITESKCGLNIDEVMSSFSDNSFNQLCVASGGVPRDFLVLFLKTIELLTESKSRISVPDVRQIAISNYSSKSKALIRDSDEESEILETYLRFIVESIFKNKRTNIFLLDNIYLENNNQVKQAIRELVDLRFLHLVDSNTSKAPSDGRRYSAYMLDTSLYENSRPRDFKEIIPGLKDERSRQDDIRSRPRVNIAEMEEYVKEKCNNKQLELSLK